jgi:hypothetical protein
MTQEKQIDRQDGGLSALCIQLNHYRLKGGRFGWRLEAA